MMKISAEAGHLWETPDGLPEKPSPSDGVTKNSLSNRDGATITFSGA
jgi:hypothetical protein